MYLPNLKFVALPIPEIIGVTQKIGQSGSGTVCEYSFLDPIRPTSDPTHGQGLTAIH